MEQKNFAHFQGKDNKNNPWYLSCCYALDKKQNTTFSQKAYSFIAFLMGFYFCNLIFYTFM